MWTSIHHYLGITLMLMLTGMGLPVPEEVWIVAAGAASNSNVGLLNPWGAFAACLIGALLGDTILYGVGYHFGHNLIRRHPRLAQLLHAEREAKIERMIRQHGFKVFFLARFMVGVRAPMYLAAGILRMKYRYFVVIDLICASCVVGLFFGLSYLYGDHIVGLIRGYEVLFTVVVCVLLAGFSLFMWWRSRRINLGATNGGDNGRPPNNVNGRPDLTSRETKSIA